MSRPNQHALPFSSRSMAETMSKSEVIDLITDLGNRLCHLFSTLRDKAWDLNNVALLLKSDLNEEDKTEMDYIIWVTVKELSDAELELFSDLEFLKHDLPLVSDQDVENNTIVWKKTVKTVKKFRENVKSIITSLSDLRDKIMEQAEVAEKMK